MGAGASSPWPSSSSSSSSRPWMAKDSNSTTKKPTRRAATTGLGDLPEGCVASVFLHLRPRQICALATVNATFQTAASSDLVWESKLPDNYAHLLDLACRAEPQGKGEKTRKVTGKKDVYALLSRPIPFDGSSKIFWLDKCRGGICMALSSKALTVNGIDDRRYWNHIPFEESRFNSVAYLRRTWWFEVKGNIDFCFPPGTYRIYFRLHLGRPTKTFGWRSSDCKHVRGWDKKPVRFQLWSSTGHYSVTEQYLGEPRGWTNYLVGDFEVTDSSTPTKIDFSMMQIDCTHPKGGLSIDCALVLSKRLHF